MKKNEYDSFCGVYCGSCDMRLADKTGHKSKFASFWSEENIETYQRAQGYTHENKDQFQVKCDGCKSDNLFINCEICKIRDCAMQKNVDHCSDCSDYQCELFKNFETGKSILPHLAQAQINLEEIKRVGTDKWYAKQSNKWRCPTCQTEFSWYSTKCQNCGSDLKKYTYGNFSWIRALLFKFGLNMMARKQKKIR